MKMNRKMREAALAAMITLALSGSALAMPSGGQVMQGNVSINGAAAGANIASVANGATIAANGHSIINWQAFGIKAGESLKFDTANGALLNRVVGNNISEILGTLTQTGSNPLLLVNPNGILVGNGAVIDASQLVLSTLALSNDDFNKFAANGIANFATDSKGAGRIMVEKGANFNIDEVLLMAGGTVNVADGVQFSIGNAKDGMVEITAADQITVDRTQKLQDSMDKIVINKDNTVSFHGTIDTNKGTGNTNVHIDGGTVNLDNATIKLNDKSEAYLMAGNKTDHSATADNIISGKNLHVNGGKETIIGSGNVTLVDSEIINKGKISILAGKKFARNHDDENDEHSMIATVSGTDSEVTIINSTIENHKQDNTDNIQINGGKVTLDKATVNSDESVNIIAVRDRNNLDKDNPNANLEDGNIITLKNGTTVNTDNITVAGKRLEKSNSSSVKVTQTDDAVYYGERVDITDSATTGYKVAPEAPILTAAPKEETTTTPAQQTEPKNEATPTPAQQTEPKNEVTPTPAQQTEPKNEVTPTPTQQTETKENVTPASASQQSFSADDTENIHKGEDKMKDIISDNNSTLAEKQSAADKMVRELSNVDATDRAKAGEVLGMLNKIKTDTSMTLAEKQVMQLTVLNAYEPTKNAKTADEQTKTAEGSRVAGQAVDTQSVQAATSANESANDVAVDASAVTE